MCGGWVRGSGSFGWVFYIEREGEGLVYRVGSSFGGSDVLVAFYAYTHFVVHVLVDEG